MNRIRIKIIIFFTAVLFCSCSTKSENKLVEKNYLADEIWFKQASVELGSKLQVNKNGFGLAISRGKGDEVKGSAYLFKEGKWQSFDQFEYSDYPQIVQYNSNTIWYLIHNTHNGHYRPRLFSYSNGLKSEIPLPKIMWDKTDYVMWNAVSVLPNGEAWMVGQQGNIIHYNGINWKEEKSPVKKSVNENFMSGDLHDVQMVSENAGWAVGKQGIIIQYKYGKWYKYQSPTNVELHSISMYDENNGWAVGDRGTILKCEAGSWKIYPSNFRITLNSVKAISKNKAWIVGARSTLLEFKNGVWLENKSIKIFDDIFSCVDVIPAGNDKYKIWIIGNNGIYTNSQSLKISFTDITSQSALRREGKCGAFQDLNSDGNVDLVTILEEGPSIIYKNKNGNIFEESPQDFDSLDKNKATLTIAVGDIDNDGCDDMIEILDDLNYRVVFGNGDCTFRAVNTKEFLNLNYMQTDISHGSAQLVDFNNDGNLDLYVSNYNNEDMLFANDGAGHFKNVFAKCGIIKLIDHRSYGAIFSDFNNDGLVDVLITYKVPNKGKHIYLFLNKGNFKFTEKDDPNFYSAGAPSTYAAISNDFNNDGFSDLVVFNNEEKLKFLINKGDASFTDKTEETGLTEKFFHPEPSNGLINAADVNNDGYLDLFIGSQLYINSPEMRFTEIGKHIGVDFVGNPSFADVDNDGDMDLFLGSSRTALGAGDRAILYRNNLITKNFLKVNLYPDKSNLDGIGSKIFLEGYDEQGRLVYKTLRQVGLGSSSAAQENHSSIHFGLPTKLSYKIKVKFPSGIEKIVEAKTNATVDIYESAPIEHFRNLIWKSITRTLLLLKWKEETVKFAILILILSCIFFYGLKTKARNLVFHVYFGIVFLSIYVLFVHFTITKPFLIANTFPIALTSLMAFGFIFFASKIIEKKESKYISHYKLLEIIGVGGMGKVFKAVDIHSRKIVALKILNPHLMADEENKQRLTTEGRLLSSITHPNIVKVYEFGESKEHVYISMEFLQGGTLQAFIEKNPLIQEKQLIDIATQICLGLQTIHSNNIIHRDIKSSNIMFDEEGKVRIMDFGLSKSPLVTTMTSLGTVIGTLGYVAPEQVTNLNIDQRVDIFSLGVILYQMATKKLPFNGENEIALIHSIFNTVPELPTNINPSISKELEEIIMKCIEKNAEDRFENVGEIIDRLSSIIIK